MKRVALCGIVVMLALASGLSLNTVVGEDEGVGPYAGASTELTIGRAYAQDCENKSCEPWWADPVFKVCSDHTDMYCVYGWDMSYNPPILRCVTGEFCAP